MESEEGYKLTSSGRVTTRLYATLNISDERPFYKYIGKHNLQYDPHNKAYYIELYKERR